MVDKMKDERAGVVQLNNFCFKLKMYSCLVDDNSYHKKAKDMNRNIVTTISHN